jgi:hypothetical protein
MIGDEGHFDRLDDRWFCELMISGGVFIFFARVNQFNLRLG